MKITISDQTNPNSYFIFIYYYLGFYLLEQKSLHIEIK